MGKKNKSKRSLNGSAVNASNKAKKQRAAAADGGTGSNVPRAPRLSPAHTHARDALAYLLHPISIETFFADYWEKRPLVINRKHPHYYDNAFADGELFSKARVDEQLKRGALRYGEQINVVKFDKQTGKVSCC